METNGWGQRVLAAVETQLCYLRFTSVVSCGGGGLSGHRLRHTQDLSAAFVGSLGHMFSWAFVFPCLPRHSPYACEKQRQSRKGLGMQTRALGSWGEGMRQGDCFLPQSPVLGRKKLSLSPCSGWCFPWRSRLPHLSKLSTEDPISTERWSFQQILKG